MSQEDEKMYQSEQPHGEFLMEALSQLEKHARERFEMQEEHARERHSQVCDMMLRHHKMSEENFTDRLWTINFSICFGVILIVAVKNL